MRILITGGAGYVGSACLRHLARHGHEVMAYDDLREGHPAALAGAALVRGDIADTARLEGALSDFGAEAVMHFAAATNVGESVENPDLHWRNNVAGSLSVLSAMRGAGVGRMVFSSTSSTYGLSDRMPMDETVTQAPANPYAHTKMAVEWMIADFADAYGLGYTLLRYFNAAGADPSGDFGEYHDPETHLIPRVLQVALGQREGLQIFGTDYDTPDGTCLRDYVHVEDLAQAHRLAIEATEADTAAAFNVGSGTGHTVREVIETCRRVTNRDIPVTEGPRRAGDPPALVCDPGRLGRELGWAPDYGRLEDIVRTAWTWHNRHPQGYGPRGAMDAGGAGTASSAGP